MASIEFVNGTSQDRVPKGTVLRVTFAQAWRIIPNALFASMVSAMYNRIAPTKLMYPISPNTTLKDKPIAVIDVRVVVGNQLAGDLVDVLSGLFGRNDMAITRVEKLTAKQAENAASNKGAGEREVQRAAQERREDWTAALGLDRLAATLGMTLKTLRWLVFAVAGVIVVGGLVYLVMTARAAVPRATAGGGAS